jgi:hypothetical protein
VEPHQNISVTPIKENHTDDLSLVKLHSTLSFLMTQFYLDRSPKLSQFIVSHIRLVVDHPEVVDCPSSRALYLGLIKQWQTITDSLLQQRHRVSIEGKMPH